MGRKVTMFFAQLFLWSGVAVAVVQFAQQHPSPVGWVIAGGLWLCGLALFISHWRE